jgi:hypothetical protein
MVCYFRVIVYSGGEHRATGNFLKAINDDIQPSIGYHLFRLGIKE